MYRPAIRQFAAAGTLALLAVAPLAACGSDPVSPLPIQTPGESGSAAPSQPAPSVSPPATAPPTGHDPPAAVKPTRTKTWAPHPASPTSSCKGAIRYDLDLRNNELALVRSMCFRAGAVLRLQGIGPGMVSVDPASLVSQDYEAGVVDIRFLRPGTVTVSIPQDEQTHTITVVVIR